MRYILHELHEKMKGNSFCIILKPPGTIPIIPFNYFMKKLTKRKLFLPNYYIQKLKKINKTVII